MSAKTNQWKLGLFVVAGIAGVIAALAWLGLERFEREVRLAYTYFDEPVDGLDPGAPVKLRGVQIGEVVEIKIAENRKHIEVKAELYVDALVRIGFLDPDNPRLWPEPFLPPELPLRAQLVSSLLTGISFIEVDFYYGVPRREIRRFRGSKHRSGG